MFCFVLFLREPEVGKVRKNPETGKIWEPESLCSQNLEGQGDKAISRI